MQVVGTIGVGYRLTVCGQGFLWSTFVCQLSPATYVIKANRVPGSHVLPEI